MNISTIIMIAAIIFFLIIPSLKDRTVSIKKLTITPLVFLYLLYETITDKFHLDQTGLMVIGLGLLAGTLIGILVRNRTAVAVNKQTLSINLPGSYINLVMFVVIFSVHYLIGYQEAVNPAFFQQISMSYYSILFLLTMASALSAGMNLCLLYKYQTAS
jgi:hypothetical protein